MRRPLVIVAILYACGLLLAEYSQPPLPQLLGAALAIALLGLLWSRARAWLLVPLIILTGWVNLLSHTALVSPHDLRTVLTAEPADVRVRGVLAESPAVRMYVRDEEESFRTLAVMNVTELKHGAQWVPARGQVMTMTPGDLSGIGYAGTAVELHGVVSPPPLPIAPGLFDYRTYLARQGIHFQVKLSSRSDWTAATPANPPLADQFIAWAQRTLGRGLPERDEPLHLLYAMTLGWKTGLTQEVYQPFMFSGTMHIFAISGLHVALIAGILVALLCLFQIPRRWCGAIVIPLLWFYTAATGWQPSAIRSTIMMSVIVGGWSLSRPSDLINSLAAAALIILVWEPQQIFQAGFQLSFCVVLSIALLTPPLKRLSDRLLAHDPLQPREVIPTWQRWLKAPFRWLSLGATTSLAAWLGSLPLTAHYFHVFSPVTLLANVMVVPLSGAALASCVGSLVCGDWFPWAGELFNNSAWFWMTLMMRISHWATTLPGAYCFIASPPAWGFAAYYLLLIGCLSGWFFRQGHRLIGIAAVAVVLAGGVWEWQRRQSEFVLTVLPLKGGHAVYLDGPGRENDWLMDCGETNSVQFITEPFLHAHGVNRLSRLLLTHGDLQHVGGAQLIWNEFQVAQAYTSPVRFRSAAYRSLIETFNGVEQHKTIARGSMVGSWRVLHPEATDNFPQADDASLVLLGRFHNTRILLLGDLGRPGQEALMRRYPYLDADIVVTGLPEKGEALCDGFIAATHPKLIIVADSEYPATKRASLQFRDRLKRAGIRVIYTRQSGAATLTMQPEGWEVRTMADADTH